MLRSAAWRSIVWAELPHAYIYGTQLPGGLPGVFVRVRSRVSAQTRRAASACGLSPNDLNQVRLAEMLILGQELGARGLCRANDQSIERIANPRKLSE